MLTKSVVKCYQRCRLWYFGKRGWNNKQFHWFTCHKNVEFGQFWALWSRAWRAILNFHKVGEKVHQTNVTEFISTALASLYEGEVKMTFWGLNLDATGSRHEERSPFFHSCIKCLKQNRQRQLITIIMHMLHLFWKENVYISLYQMFLVFTVKCMM